MSTSSSVEAQAPETRRSRREAALLDARAATAPAVAVPATVDSAASAPVPVVGPASTAHVTSPYGTLGRPAARIVVPDLEPDVAEATPTAAPARTAAARPASVAPAPTSAVAPAPPEQVTVRPATVRQHDLLGRPAPTTSWAPAPQPSITRSAELADAAVAARSSLQVGVRPGGVTPARPSAVTDTGPVPRTPVVAPVPAVAPVLPVATARTVAPAAVTDPAPRAVPVADPAPSSTGHRSRRDVVAAERRQAGRGAPRKGPRRPSVTRSARAGVLATLAIATVAVPLAQGSAGGDAPAIVRDYASGRTTVDVLMSPRGLSDSSVIVADTLAGRDLAVASRSESRTEIAGCDTTVTVATSINGRLSSSQLCDLPQAGHQLQPRAAVAFTELNAQFEARFGSEICISDSYRSLSGQYSVAASRGAYAARPGTSQHGLGLALDLCSSTYRDSAKWSWLKANAPVFGFDNPAWARRGGSGMYEPWHWEYFPLVDY